MPRTNPPEQTGIRVTNDPNAVPAEGYKRSDFFRDLKKAAKRQDRPSQRGQEKR